MQDRNCGVELRSTLRQFHIIPCQINSSPDHPPGWLGRKKNGPCRTVRFFMKAPGRLLAGCVFHLFSNLLHVLAEAIDGIATGQGGDRKQGHQHQRYSTLHNRLLGTIRWAWGNIAQTVVTAAIRSPAGSKFD
jgi:hypothetical protein